MDITRRTALTTLTATTVLTAPLFRSAALASPKVDLSPARWPAGEYDRFMKAQGVERTSAGAAHGLHGAVTVAYSGLAARAGLEALKQGGNAIDAAMTTAMAQIVLAAGAPISFFGIMSLVYYEARTGKTHTMNAEWNTLLEETDPKGIPGGVRYGSMESLRGLGPPSGRTALVGGFMKGVEQAHKRLGKLPFASLFAPSIYIAEKGMPITPYLAEIFAMRDQDIRRLAATRETLVKPNGTAYAAGDTFRQPALAKTLRAVATHGADYMYKGPWGQKLITAIQADGGKMTMEDLARYEVLWADPLVADLHAGYSIHTNAAPNAGGAALIEAQNLAEAAGLCGGEHWTKSAESLRKALMVAQRFTAGSTPLEQRISKDNAATVWRRLESGEEKQRWKRTSPMHSDDVVAIDSEGNMAAITHTINCVNWGKTAINVDGVSIGDPGSFQQAAIAALKPGSRMPAPTETGILFKDGVAVLGFASMGNGLHARTFQGLLNFTCFGMDVEQAINTPDFYMPSFDPNTGEMTVIVPKGKFDHKVLDGTGFAWREIPLSESRWGGEGKWVAISRDPGTHMLKAASHNRNNSDAVAF